MRWAPYPTTHDLVGEILEEEHRFSPPKQLPPPLTEHEKEERARLEKEAKARNLPIATRRLEQIRRAKCVPAHAVYPEHIEPR